MNSALIITYCCPVCGYTWDDFCSLGMAGDCQCPNCEEPVTGLPRSA